MNSPGNLPSHLPQRLTISFWLWNYFYGVGPGDAFADLEKCFDQLRERGFNAIRVDSGAGLCFASDGKPRGPVALRRPFGEFTTLRQMAFAGPGSRVDVLRRLTELFELAQRYEVAVILSSWFYLHTFWFVEGEVREEPLALAPARRFWYFAEEADRLVSHLKERGLEKQLAFTEIFNEIDGFPGQWGLVGPETPPTKAEQVYRQLREPHEQALAWLQERHPDLLWAADTASSGGAAEQLLPRNAQLWNHHMYYSWPIYFRLLEDYVHAPGFDFEHPSRHPAIGRFLHDPPPSLAAVRATQNDDPRVEPGWYRRVWLFNSLKPDARPELERLFAESLERDQAEYRRYAEEGVARAVQVRDAVLPGRPLVMGEGATYCADMQMRWEEESDSYWELIAHTLRLLREQGYWGSVPRTNSGPEDPVWREYPDCLRAANESFLKD